MKSKKTLVIQWNPSIAATVGEWHFGCYMEVAVVERFCVLGVLVHKKILKSDQLLFVQRFYMYMYVHVVN